MPNTTDKTVPLELTAAPSIEKQIFVVRGR